MAWVSTIDWTRNLSLHLTSGGGSSRSITKTNSQALASALQNGSITLDVGGAARLDDARRRFNAVLKRRRRLDLEYNGLHSMVADLKRLRSNPGEWTCRAL